MNTPLKKLTYVKSYKKINAQLFKKYCKYNNSNSIKIMLFLSQCNIFQKINV